MNLASLRDDPDFLGLPETERAKVVESLVSRDSNFKALPETEQIKVLSTLVGTSKAPILKGEKQQPQPTKVSEAPQEQSFQNLVRQGFADFGNTVGMLGGFFTPQTPKMDAQGRPIAGSMPSVGQQMTDVGQTGREVASSISKPVTTKAPTDIGGKMYESAVKALGDPTSWLGGGASITKILGSAIGSSMVAGTAELTGSAGALTEKALTGKDTGVGRMVGSLGAAPNSAVLQGVAKAGIAVPAKNIYNKYKDISANPTQAEKSLSTGAAKRLLEKAASEQGIENVEEFVKDFNTIGNRINKQNVPLFVALADNPAIHTQFIRLYKTDDDFRAQVNSQLATLSQSIDNNADKLFGVRMADMPKDTPANLKGARKRIDVLNSRIDDLSYRITPNQSQEQLGSDITALVEAKKQAVKAELQPSYAKLMEDAKAEGISISPENTQVIGDFIYENKLRDIFGKGTALDKKITSVIDDGQGLSFEDVDSLKRNINSLKRETLSAEQMRKVKQLEEVVNNVRETLPNGFNQRLKDLDLMYYERMGVPFNSANINDIDAKKYAEQVAPAIVRNGSGLKQFLSATGEDGLPIARNAVIAEAYKVAVKDGKVDLKALSRFIKTKDDVLQELPNVREELKALGFDQTKLMVEKGKLDEAYKVQEKRLANSFLAGQEGNPDFTNITNRMLSDRRYLNKVLTTDLKMVSPETRKAVVNNIRREFMDKAINSKEGVATLLDPRNKPFVDAIFGTAYTKNLRGTLALSDKISKLDVNRIPAVFSNEELDSVGAYAKSIGLTGLNLPNISSTLRDRIASNFQKGVRLFSTVNQKRVAEATNNQIKELLIDPDGLAKFMKIANQPDFKLENPFSLKAITDAVGERLPLYMYQSAKVGANGEEQQPQAEIPEDFIGGSFE